MKRWFEALAQLAGRGDPYVLITVLAVSGSTPREAGAKMVVHTDGQVDTIGGGQLEYLVTERARELLAANTSGQAIEHFPLAAAALQCCGGSMTVLFEAQRANHPLVYLFGAGHVGTRVAQLLAELPAQLHWFDSRDPAVRAAAAQGPACQLLDDPATIVPTIPAAAHALVMTHDHQLDFTLVAELLRGPCGSIGLIGSATKWQRFQARLRQQGFTEDALSRVRCPLGDATIASKQPMAIAITIVNELLAIDGQRRAPAGAETTLDWSQIGSRLVRTGSIEEPR